jgi:hypothetical protein
MALQAGRDLASGGRAVRHRGRTGGGGRGRPGPRTRPADLPRQRPPDPQAMPRPDPGPWPAAGQGRASASTRPRLARPSGQGGADAGHLMRLPGGGRPLEVDGTSSGRPGCAWRDQPFSQRTHTICIRSAPGRDFLNGQKTGAAGQGWAICRVARRARRDKRRATRRSKETGQWAAAGIQRQRHRRLARSTRRSSSPWVVPGRCLRLWLEPCRALFGECVAGNQLRCTATRPSPSIRSSA